MASYLAGPTSYRLNAIAGDGFAPSVLGRASELSLKIFKRVEDGGAHPSHPALGHLVLLVFEAVLEVVCVSLPGYIVARAGMFDAENQKFVANLNVALFTPCLSRFKWLRAVVPTTNSNISFHQIGVPVNGRQTLGISRDSHHLRCANRSLVYRVNSGI